MICDICKHNTATVFYRQSINGEETSYSLCPECAAKLQAEKKINTGMPFFSDFDSFFTPLFERSPLETAADELCCDLCGLKYSDIASTGKVGCPKCYEVFRDKLADAVRSIHGNARHIGRRPKALGGAKQENGGDKISELKAKLEKAASEENYELCAKLRDEIRALESKEEKSK